ncbi:MAG TPA: hypothetical protein VN853_09005 [Polyangia bacterium]|nr:hypothetical protein [Polyangia bacterium]
MTIENPVKVIVFVIAGYCGASIATVLDASEERGGGRLAGAMTVPHNDPTTTETAQRKASDRIFVPRFRGAPDAGPTPTAPRLTARDFARLPCALDGAIPRW